MLYREVSILEFFLRCVLLVFHVLRSTSSSSDQSLLGTDEAQRMGAELVQKWLACLCENALLVTRFDYT